MTEPLNAIGRVGSAGKMRFRTAKSGLFGPFWKVATLPVGRKSIGAGPGRASSGFQSMIALVLSTVIVSLVGELLVRVAVPATTVAPPLNACAPARSAVRVMPAIVPIAAER